MTEISQKAQELIARQTKCFHERIKPQLESVGISIVRWSDLRESELHYVNQIFQEKIFPVLTPLAVDPSHPFPIHLGLSLNLPVVIESERR
jgi:polyphosphate kinase